MTPAPVPVVHIMGSNPPKNQIVKVPDDRMKSGGCTAILQYQSIRMNLLLDLFRFGLQRLNHLRPNG